MVSLYSVVPALIATKDGGATPVKQPGGIQVSQRTTNNTKINSTEEIDSLTKKGTNEENPQRHIDDR